MMRARGIQSVSSPSIRWPMLSKGLNVSGPSVPRAQGVLTSCRSARSASGVRSRTSIAFGTAKVTSAAPLRNGTDAQYDESLARAIVPPQLERPFPRTGRRPRRTPCHRHCVADRRAPSLPAASPYSGRRRARQGVRSACTPTSRPAGTRRLVRPQRQRERPCAARNVWGGAAVFVHYGYRPGGLGGTGSRGIRAGSHGSGGRGFGGSGSLTGPGSFLIGGNPIVYLLVSDAFR